MVARVRVELGTSGTCWHHLKPIMHPRTIELSDRLESPIMHQDPKPQRILVAGGSGFIGRRLIAKLTESSSSHEIICLTRKPESLHGVLGDSVKVLKGMYRFNLKLSGLCRVWTLHFTWCMLWKVIQKGGKNLQNAIDLPRRISQEQPAIVELSASSTWAD